MAISSVLLLMAMLSSSCSSGAAVAGWAGITMYNGDIFTVSGSGQLNIISAADLSSAGVIPIVETNSAGFSCAPASSAVAIYGTPVVDGNRVYMAGYNGKIYVYSLTTNSFVVESKVLDNDNNHTIVGGIIVGNGLVYVGSSNGNLYALDADTLERAWKFSTNGKIWSTPVLVNGTVFVGSFDKNVYAIDATTGEEKWSNPIGGAMMATPVVVGGVVYVVSFDRHIYAFNEITGEQKWKTPVDEQNNKTPKEWFWATPVLFNGFLYAPCLDGYVYAVDITNPSNIIAFDLQASISASPVVSGGKVVVVTEKGQVYTLDATSKSQRLVVDLRIADIQASLTVRSQVYAEDGVVYIHSLFPDKVYAITDLDTGAFRSRAMEAVSGNAAPVTVTVTETKTVTVTK